MSEKKKSNYKTVDIMNTIGQKQRLFEPIHHLLCGLSDPGMMLQPPFAKQEMEQIIQMRGKHVQLEATFYFAAIIQNGAC